MDGLYRITRNASIFKPFIKAMIGFNFVNRMDQGAEWKSGPVQASGINTQLSSSCFAQSGC
jgi:hypothetical protein